MNYRTSADGVAPLANKLGALLSTPWSRNSLPGRRATIAVPQNDGRGGILVINLSKGQLGGDMANVLGGIFLASIVNAAFSQIRHSRRGPNTFHSLCR